MTATADARRSLGRLGERLAAEHLMARGYRVLGRNLRSPSGEIDLVALDGDCLVVVEVRTRRGRAFGLPEESVTPRKRAKLLTLAQEYNQSHPELPQNVRIDVVAVELSPGGRLLRLEHLPSAVEEP